MKTIDIYIIKQLLSNFVLVIMVFLSASMTFDFTEKIGDFFRENGPSLSEIFGQYYLGFSLFIITRLWVIVSFLAATVTAVQLAQRTEIIAMISCNITYNRILKVFAMVGIFLGIGNYLLNNFITPYGNAARLKFENKYTNYTSATKHNHIALSDSLIAYYDYYDFKLKDHVDWLGLDYFDEDNNGQKRLVREILVQKAYGSKENNNWKFENYTIKSFNPDGTEVLIQGKMLDTVLSFKSNDLAERIQVTATMNLFELKKYREEQFRKGSSRVAYIDLLLYSRNSTPFAVVIMVIIAFTVCSHKSRQGGIWANVVIGILLACMYEVGVQMFSVAAFKAGFNPILAVWIPNLIYFLIAIYFYKKAPK